MSCDSNENSALFLLFVACPHLSELTIFVPLHNTTLSAFDFSSFTAMLSQITTSGLLTGFVDMVLILSVCD